MARRPERDDGQDLEPADLHRLAVRQILDGNSAAREVAAARVVGDAGVAGERGPAGDVIGLEVRVEDRPEPEPLGLEEPPVEVEPAVRVDHDGVLALRDHVREASAPEAENLPEADRSGAGDRADHRAEAPGDHAAREIDGGKPAALENLGDVGGGAALGADDDQIAAAAEPVRHLPDRGLLLLDELEVGDVEDLDRLRPFHPPPRELLGVADVEDPSGRGTRKTLVKIRGREVRHGRPAA